MDWYQMLCFETMNPTDVQQSHDFYLCSYCMDFNQTEQIFMVPRGHVGKHLISSHINENHHLTQIIVCVMIWLFRNPSDTPTSHDYTLFLVLISEWKNVYMLSP